MSSSSDRPATLIDQIAGQSALLEIISRHASNLIAITDLEGKTLYQSLSHQQILGSAIAPNIDPNEDSDRYANQNPNQKANSNIGNINKTNKLSEVTQESTNQTTHLYWQQVHPADRQHFRTALEEVAQTGSEQVIECRFRYTNGNWLAIETSISLIEINSQPCQGDRQSSACLLFCSNNISDLKLADKAIRSRDARIKNLCEQDRLIAAIAQRIHQSLDLEDILNSVVAELRQMLQCDRVVVYRYKPDGSGTVIVESVAEPWDSVLGVKQDCGAHEQAMMWVRLSRCEPSIINDIYQANLSSCHFDFLKNLQVRANLVVPIVLKPIDEDHQSPVDDNNHPVAKPNPNSTLDDLGLDTNAKFNNLSHKPTQPQISTETSLTAIENAQIPSLDNINNAENSDAKQNNVSADLPNNPDHADINANWAMPKNDNGLWGLIIAHQCSAPRHWHTENVLLLQKLSYQVAIAIMQSDLLTKERSQQIELAQQNIVLESAFQQIKNAAESKRQFLANISHEIRTPMNGIMGIAELLADTKLDNRQQSLVRTIQASGQNLLQIINDILDYARSQAKEISVVVSEFNLVEYIEEVVNLAAIQAHAKDIEVFSYIDANVPCMLVGDGGDYARYSPI
jgi:GAF domain-containing protein